MQINTLFQGMLNIGTSTTGPSGQSSSSEDAAQQFEDLLVEQAQQSRPEKPAAKKDAAKTEKPQQAQKSESETSEEGMEVAAGLVTAQPVVLFDVVNADSGEQAVQVVDPMAGMAQQASVVQEVLAPVEETAARPVEQQVEAVPEETGFQEEMQQVPAVEDQPEAQDVQVDVSSQEQAVEHVHVERAGEAPQEQAEDTQVKDVEVEAEPVFHKETAVPVKVGESYEPVAPEEPEAPKQITDRLVQMLAQGDTRVEIQLTPENLGSMTIEITRMHDGALHVVLGAVSQKATALLQQNSANLHSLLAANNDGEVRIEVQQQEPQQQLGQFLNPDEQGKQQPQQQHKPQQQAETEDFVQQLKLGLVEKDEE